MTEVEACVKGVINGFDDKKQATGVALRDGIVSELGGSIYARSQLGEGATFVVELPVNGQ
jgi:signal transduction histidine kinase